MIGMAALVLAFAFGKADLFTTEPKNELDFMIRVVKFTPFVLLAIILLPAFFISELRDQWRELHAPEGEKS